MNKLFLFSIVSVSIFCSSRSHAEIVVWDAAQNTTSASDVSTRGTLLNAFNAGQASTTVNGVSFVAASPFTFTTAGNAFLAPPAGNTGDANLNILLGQASFQGGGINEGVIDLGLFDFGRTYEVQVFFVDQRTPSRDRLTRFGSVDGVSMVSNSVDLESDPNNDPASIFGQFAIGTFVGDGNNPDLTVTGLNYASAQINAWQIRDITSAVPEPSTALMLGSVLMAGGFFRRRSKTQQ